MKYKIGDKVIFDRKDGDVDLRLLLLITKASDTGYDGQTLKILRGKTGAKEIGSSGKYTDPYLFPPEETNWQGRLSK